MTPVGRCDCIRCESVRLAWRLFLAAIAIMVLVALAHHVGERPSLLIEKGVTR